jgi:hypothetical protein
VRLYETVICPSALMSTLVILTFKPVPGAPVAAGVVVKGAEGEVAVAGLDVTAVEDCGAAVGVVCACCEQDDRAMATTKAVDRTASEVVSKTHLFIRPFLSNIFSLQNWKHVDCL